MNPVKQYLSEIAHYFEDRNSSEMSYRTPFQVLLESIFPRSEKFTVQHDQRAVSGNKPDFIVLKNGIPVLYLEVKTVGENLDKIEKSNQATRYFGYTNLIISDYCEFRFYRNGDQYNSPITLATVNTLTKNLIPDSSKEEMFIRTVREFCEEQKEPIKSGAHLARIMGGKAQRIRDNVKEMLQSASDKYVDLRKMLDVVKEHLVAGLDDETFADMYAQTLVYGLFAARYNDTTPDTFTRSEARELVPKSNPFLRSFFDHIAGESFPERLRFIVDELCEVFTHADIEKILHDFYGKEKDNKDPIIHFYEDFLKEYDSKKKMEMGVFYTPRPVVQFIVRSVDDILKSDFGLEKGLSDTSKVKVEKKEGDAKGKEKKVQKEYHKIQVLDVATGTGTFLNEVIEHIHRGFVGQEGRWPAYVENDLLPRLHGFELMMASYTIAHLKLGMTLHDTGATKVNTRLGVYLTNTLEAPVDYANQHTLFGIMDSIAQESKNASRIKSEYPIMCVIGNPPYSGISMNKHYTDNNAYKVEPGGLQKLQEKKHWLDDDYVKFIRFAESLIEKNGEGIMGMITAHGYIDNPTFRGMRWHLRKTFDKVYVVDLHGSSTKKEKSPDGSKDENVFDIKTGVSIILGVKKKTDSKTKKPAQVYQTDLYGIRKNKYQKLNEDTIESMEWNLLSEGTEMWRTEGIGGTEYAYGFSVEDLFIESTSGFATAKDSVNIGFSKDEIQKHLEDFLNLSESEFRKKYQAGKDSRDWKYEYAKEDARNIDPDKFVEVSYRPFDTRWTYYTGRSRGLYASPQQKIMQNFLRGSNVGFCAVNLGRNSDYHNYFLTKYITDKGVNSSLDNSSVFPLYIYPDSGEKIPNLDKEILLKIAETVGQLSPENILDYIYAVLHSPSYREKYKEFLKTGFPRVPYPRNEEEFWKLVPLGTKLRELHLMESSESQNKTITFPEVGNDKVEKVSYTDGKVYINDTQYFGSVPEVTWNFYIGGYQPAQKWLKDRKERKLSSEDIEHYERIITVLAETNKLMREIDKIK